MATRTSQMRHLTVMRASHGVSSQTIGDHGETGDIPSVSVPIAQLDGKRVARLFHALADETRLRIVEKLADGEQCVCDLTEALETGQSRLSFHLKTLREAGIVTDRRDGRWIYYSLNPAGLTELFQEMTRVIGMAKVSTPRATRCCD